jgi:hypothetical protein
MACSGPAFPEPLMLHKTTYFIFDILLILGGGAGLTLGLPAVNEFFSRAFVQGASIALIVLAIVALIGLLRDVWLAELIAKSGIIGWFALYMGSVLVLTARGDEDRGFVIILAALPILIAGDRILRAARVESGKRWVKSRGGS